MKLLGFLLMFLSFYWLEQGYVTLSGIFWFLVGAAMFFNEVLLTIWIVKTCGKRGRR
jgi:membrane-bound ClpP family serine protease